MTKQFTPHPPGRHTTSTDDEVSGMPEEIIHRAGRLAIARIHHAHQEIGDALLAYLTLPGSNPASDHLEYDFHTTYRGDHATIDEAIQTHLDSLGWGDALKQMMHANGIATGRSSGISTS